MEMNVVDMPKLKPVPKFKSEKAEQAFWAKHDSSDYLDWSKAKLIEVIFNGAA